MAFPPDLTAQRAALASNIEEVRSLLLDAHPPVSRTPDIGPTARGLSMVMLFAAYEKLLKSTCVSLLEAAGAIGVKNRRLHPGLRLFAVYPLLQGVNASGKNAIWSNHGPEIVKRLAEGDCSQIATSVFPDDGSFMKPSQVELFCELFRLGHPARVLREVWPRLDQVVRDRNAVAHGNETAEQVGRRYSFDDVLVLTYFWHLRWHEFADHVEHSGSVRSFFRSG